MQNHIFFKIDNRKDELFTSIDLNSPADIAGIAKKISSRLSVIHKRGTLVVHDLPHDITRSLALAGWYTGWKIAFLPSHLSEKNKQLILEELNPHLIVYCNWEHLQSHDITLDRPVFCLDGKNISHFVHWLEESDRYTPTLNNRAYGWTYQEAALIAFTSGTTGEPKAVFHSLLSILVAAERFIKQFDISSQDRLLNTAMVHTIAGVRCSVVMPLLTGCMVNNAPIAGGIFQIIDTLEREESTVVLTGPSVIRQIALVKDKIERLPDSLRVIVCGGSPLDRECRTQIFTKFQVKVLDGYGFTESGGAIIAESEDTYNSTNLAMGKACHNVKLKIIDGEGREHNHGDGELRVYCSSIFLGYLGDRLSSRPFFDTGDMVNIDLVGNVTYLFRIKNGIKTVGSEWIYAEAVEHWLRKNTQVVDIHVSGLVDRLGRPKFQAEIVGIDSENWQAWLDHTYKSLVVDLGRDYQVIDWCRVESIERSSFGKYQKSIY
jgi:acyl-coenzyme A synthetase/AMP-(fatty) acid ligase